MMFGDVVDAEPLVRAQNPGVYAIVGAQDLASPGTTSGRIGQGGVPHLLVRTTHVCARLHTSFGVQFELPAEAGVDAMPVEVTVTHPQMMNQAGVLQDADRFTTTLPAGQPHYLGWTFDDPARLLGGDWDIAVSHGGVRLSYQAFVVEFNCGVPVS